ncbi:MAG: PqqD family protein [Acidobacteriota bacterium]
MKNKIENPAALARNDELVVQDLPDEVLVYDLKSHKAHCLNKTAAFIWNHCDGQRTADEIARLMEKEWHTPVTEDAVWFALNKLSKAELLQERIVLPEAKAGMSRRSAVRRLGFGALLAVPVVMSIVTPTPAAAASVPIECQACVKKNDTSGNCPNVCINFCGSCFDNSGCGNGQFAGCKTCSACLDGPASGGVGTVSWTAPGSQGCGSTVQCV